MPAPKGNTYAEKWTTEAVLAALAQVEKQCKKQGCYYLLSALVDCGYYSDVWAYWKEKFSEDPEVFRTIKRIEDYLEQKLVKAGLNGDINTASWIFVAKCKFGFKEPPTENRNFNHNALADLSDEELNAEIERLERIRKAIQE
jgi:hypothetical protein